MPYRIRRRPGTPEARNEISTELSNIQSRIAFQHAWLHIEATEVAAAYDLLIRAARAEAGLQMKEAWTRPAPTSDQQMTLEGAYPRTQLDSARSECITLMRPGKDERAVGSTATKMISHKVPHDPLRGAVAPPVRLVRPS